MTNAKPEELGTVAYRWQLDTWPDDHWGLSELSQLECHSGAFGQPIQEELVRRSEAAALISQLTAERDDLRTTAKLLLGWKDRAEAAEQRVKELEEGRDLDRVVLDEGIEIINELESSNKLLSERVAVLEGENTQLRSIVSECAAAANGFATPIASIEFMRSVPKEITLAIRRARTGLEGK